MESEVHLHEKYPAASGFYDSERTTCFYFLYWDMGMYIGNGSRSWKFHTSKLPLIHVLIKFIVKYSCFLSDPPEGELDLGTNRQGTI